MLMLVACSEHNSTDNNKTEKIEEIETVGFEQIASEISGIDFANKFEETEERNYYNFEYVYNG